MKCNGWNPFELPYRLYQEGNKDKAQVLLEELKTLKLFEAIILMPRIMPIKTLLLSHEELKKYFN